MPIPALCRSTTRARSCSRRRRVCSSTSWWSTSASSASPSACRARAWRLREHGVIPCGGRRARHVQHGAMHSQDHNMRLSSSLSRRGALAIAAATLLLSAGTAGAQGAWPNKPVRIVVPFAPGGTTDILARAVAPELSKAFGQQFIVDNRAGAGGNVGADIVAKSPGDGYTLLMGTVGTHGINRALYTKLSYDPIKDFAPVTLVAGVPNVMVMQADKARSMGINNVRDFI